MSEVDYSTNAGHTDGAVISDFVGDGTNPAVLASPSLFVGLIQFAVNQPQGMPITSATLSLSIAASPSETIRLRGELLANATWPGSAGIAAGRATTTAFADASVSAGTVVSWDVTAIIQEILDQPDWSAGNFLILQSVTGGGPSDVEFKSDGGAGTVADRPTLTIVSPDFEEFVGTGSTPWTAPATMVVTVRNRGGGGGAGMNSSSEGGGGGGAFAADDISVTVGQVYDLVAPTPAAQGVAGGDTSFSLSGTPLVVAQGGQPGATGSTGGGTGGLASGSIGSIKNDGGSGGTGRVPNATGGGGGGSGGNSAAGNNGTSGISGGAGAPAVDGGGRGGNGGVSADGSTGDPGGGGGGGGPSHDGAAGGAGRILLIYDLPSVPSTNPAAMLLMI